MKKKSVIDILPLQLFFYYSFLLGLNLRWVCMEDCLL